MIIEIQNPEVEAKIIAQAQAQGVSVEEFIESLIEDLHGAYIDTVETDDPRIAAMREAMNDEMFLADLVETMEDFKYVDAEYSH